MHRPRSLTSPHASLGQRLASLSEYLLLKLSRALTPQPAPLPPRLQRDCGLDDLEAHEGLQDRLHQAARQQLDLALLRLP